MINFRSLGEGRRSKVAGKWPEIEFLAGAPLGFHVDSEGNKERKKEKEK